MNDFSRVSGLSLSRNTSNRIPTLSQSMQRSRETRLLSEYGKQIEARNRNGSALMNQSMQESSQINQQRSRLDNYRNQDQY